MTEKLFQLYKHISRPIYLLLFQNDKAIECKDSAIRLLQNNFPPISILLGLLVARHNFREQWEQQAVNKQQECFNAYWLLFSPKGQVEYEWEEWWTHTQCRSSYSTPKRQQNILKSFTWGIMSAHLNMNVCQPGDRHTQPTPSLYSLSLQKHRHHSAVETLASL